MLTYQVLGPDHEGFFSVAYVIPDQFPDHAHHGRYAVVGKARTRDQADEQARQLNAPPCERRLALRAKANRIVQDIPEDEKKRRGII